MRDFVTRSLSDARAQNEKVSIPLRHYSVLTIGHREHRQYSPIEYLVYIIYSVFTIGNRSLKLIEPQSHIKPRLLFPLPHKFCFHH